MIEKSFWWLVVPERAAICLSNATISPPRSIYRHSTVYSHIVSCPLFHIHWGSCICFKTRMKPIEVHSIRTFSKSFALLFLSFYYLLNFARTVIRNHWTILSSNLHNGIPQEPRWESLQKNSEPQQQSHEEYQGTVHVSDRPPREKKIRQVKS